MIWSQCTKAMFEQTGYTEWVMRTGESNVIMWSKSIDCSEQVNSNEIAVYFRWIGRCERML